jgi:para-aminobenzoate synthetase component 1
MSSWDMSLINTHIKNENRIDIYETNYCMQLQSKAQCEEPYQHWLYLYQKNPAPHAAYFKWNQFHLMCLSPERFIKKIGSRLISQPIKGTTARQDDSTKNQEAIASLLNNPKERSENTMIVDLVRNDMSKIAQSKSVEVTELCGIHSFSTLHHMISTIECSTYPNTSLVQIFQALFPMGSMTGVPKKSAVSITHQLEQNSRGWYSGTCGWIDPEGNFDFNVIIRSIIFISIIIIIRSIVIVGSIVITRGTSIITPTTRKASPQAIGDMPPARSSVQPTTSGPTKPPA